MKAPTVKAIATAATVVVVALTDAEAAVSGYIVMRKSRTINFTRCDTGLVTFCYGPERKYTEVDVSRIRDLVLGEHGKCAFITLRDGRTTSGYRADHYWAPGNGWGSGVRFSYECFDDVDGRVRRSPMYALKT